MDIYPNYYLNSLCPKDILMQMSFQSISEMHCLNSLPNLYQQLLLANSRSKLFDPLLTKEDIFSKILWGNRLIKVGNECLFSHSMIDSNIILVKDILNMNEQLKQIFLMN